MLNVLLITIPVYDEQDGSIMESVGRAISESSPDFISISYYHDSKPHCLFLALSNTGSAEILDTHVKRWRKWEKVDPEMKNYWQNLVPGLIELYSVAGAFEVEVERRVRGITGLCLATLWDTSREGIVEEDWPEPEATFWQRVGSYEYEVGSKGYTGRHRCARN